MRGRRRLPSKTIKKDDEVDPHSGRRENGSRSYRGIIEEQSGTRQVKASDVKDYLEEALDHDGHTYQIGCHIWGNEC